MQGPRPSIDNHALQANEVSFYTRHLSSPTQTIRNVLYFIIMSDSRIRPFKIQVPQIEVDRLEAKVKDTRLPGRSIVPDAGIKYGMQSLISQFFQRWDYSVSGRKHILTRLCFSGPTLEWADNLLKAWKTFDWNVAQEKMNRVPHFIAEVEGLDIHFVHAKARSAKKGIPLLMIHGWPGSFWEFSQVWDRLSNPTSSDEIAFDVVVPSMPGFCWSSWPPRSGWTLKDNARVFDQLMKMLGYEKYMVQCGDWGQFVGRELGAQYPNSCRLLHLNFAPSPLPEGAELTEREAAVQGRVDDWLENHMGYAVCMRSRVSIVKPRRLDIADKSQAAYNRVRFPR